MINYILTINIISLITYGYDKYSAIRKKYRIPEKILLLLSIMGGSIGSILGMFLFHHKTKKIKFMLLNPTILFIQIIIFILVRS